MNLDSHKKYVDPTAQRVLMMPITNLTAGRDSAAMCGCYVCGEAGQLVCHMHMNAADRSCCGQVCCDQCPAQFHLVCMGSNQARTQWLCTNCSKVPTADAADGPIAERVFSIYCSQPVTEFEVINGNRLPTADVLYCRRKMR